MVYTWIFSSDLSPVFLNPIGYKTKYKSVKLILFQKKFDGLFLEITHNGSPSPYDSFTFVLSIVCYHPFFEILLDINKV